MKRRLVEGHKAKAKVTLFPFRYMYAAKSTRGKLVHASSVSRPPSLIDKEHASVTHTLPCYSTRAQVQCDAMRCNAGTARHCNHNRASHHWPHPPWLKNEAKMPTSNIQTGPLPFEVNDMDRQILSQTDEEFRLHTWDDLKRVIGLYTRTSFPFPFRHEADRLQRKTTLPPCDANRRICFAT